MPARQDDDTAGHTPRPAAADPSRSLPLATAVALAVAASLFAFLTTDARVLRAGVVLAAWAVVAAACVAVRRRTEAQAAVARERELRRAFDRELDLEAADRREHELALENDLRRRADEALRGELATLRAGIAELALLREQLGRVSGLGDSLAGLARLREDVAALGALRGDLGGLRGDLARLRAELTDPGPGELPVEPSWTPAPRVAAPVRHEPVRHEPVRPVPYRRRTDEPAAPPPDPARAVTTEHRAPRPAQRPPAPPTGAAPGVDAAAARPVADILAETGSRPAVGRRRRYREDGEADDVLARVLRGG